MSRSLTAKIHSGHGVCVCLCRNLRLTQPLGIRSPCLLAPSYFLPLQGAVLDFSLVVWFVHLDPRQLLPAAAPCFRHNPNPVARGMNRAPTIHAIFFPRSLACSLSFFFFNSVVMMFLGLVFLSKGFLELLKFVACCLLYVRKFLSHCFLVLLPHFFLFLLVFQLYVC